jgi:hypothetical protein
MAVDPNLLVFKPYNAAQELMQAEVLRGARTDNALNTIKLAQAQDQGSPTNVLARANATAAQAQASSAEVEAALPRLKAALSALEAVQTTTEAKGATAGRQRLTERLSFLKSQGVLPKDFDLGIDPTELDDEEFAQQIEAARGQLADTLSAISPAAPDEFTLKPGEVRFENGRPIAAVPSETKETTQQFREGTEYVTRRVINGKPDMSPGGVVARSPISESAPKTTVTVEGDKTIPAALVSAATDLSNKADTLAAQVQDLAQMRDMVTDAKTGALTPVTLPVKAAFAAIGIQLDDQVSLLQAIEAQQNQLALRFRNPQSGFGLTGNTSNQDVKFLKATVPGLEKTPQANVAIATILLAKQRREAELAALKSDYIWTNGTLKGWDQARKEYIDQHSLFSADDKQTIEALSIPRVNSQADYDAVPSGKVYIDPNGERRTKR